MRRPRNFQTDRYYHLVNRVVHRAFYLDEYEPWHEVTPPLPLHQWGLTLWRFPVGRGITDVSGNAKAWTVTAKGREEFNKFKVDGDSVTITLASDEMVLIQ